MKRTNHLVSVLICCLTVLAGCQRADQGADPVVTTPPRSMPAEDVPPAAQRDNAYVETSVKPKVRPAVPDEDKAALLYAAKLDLLRVLICSEEQIQVGSETHSTDTLLQVASEHFTNIGFRVIDGAPCPGYSSSAEILEVTASQRDVDMFVLLTAGSKPADKFGEFYSFEADGRGKVAQISDKELLTTTSASVRGKRALDERQAGESALAECGKALAVKLSDEILRKSARGALLRRVSIGQRQTGGPGTSWAVREAWDSVCGTQELGREHRAGCLLGSAGRQRKGEPCCLP